MQYEVEQKFRARSPEQVRGKMDRLGARFRDEVRQTDRYFNHPARDFAVTDEAFRIRSVGDENVLTYKGPKIDSTTKTRREIELAVGRGAPEVERWVELVVALGFRPVATVSKHRTGAELEWEGSVFEIALDRVDQVGEFVELELQADDAELDQARRCLLSLADALDLGTPERRSYLQLLLDAGR